MRNLKEEYKILYSAIEFKIQTMNFGGDRTSYKSPAENGFFKEFYETFFELIGLHLLNSYNDAFNKGQLSISQRRGVTCFMPKDDSCLIELTNWRPLTLLNADFKILANLKLLAKELRKRSPC